MVLLHTTQDTLRPRDFVDDFPLHLWLFLPREKARGPPGAKFSTPAISTINNLTTHIAKIEGDRASDSTAGDTTSGEGCQGLYAPPLQLSSLPPETNGNDNADSLPMISFVAHVPSPIRAELERLQFLFLLRLKDSLTELKASAMKFLDLLQPLKDEGDAPLVTSPVTPRSRSLGNRHNTLTSDDIEGAVATDPDPVKPVSNPFSEDETEDEEEKSSSASIAGCVIVRSLQADILLPSLFNEATQQVSAAGVGVGVDTPINSPPLLLSPSSSLIGAMPLSQSATPPSQSGTPTKAGSPLRPLPVPPSPLTQSTTLSPSLLPHPPPSPMSGSQSSLHSQTSQTGLTRETRETSQTSQTGLTRETRGSSQTSQTGLTRETRETSQASQTSQTSFSKETSGTGQTSQYEFYSQQTLARAVSETRLTSLKTGQSSSQTRLTGSQISLPVLLEAGGQSSSVHHDDRVGYYDNQEVVEGGFVVVDEINWASQMRLEVTRPCLCMCVTSIQCM